MLPERPPRFSEAPQLTRDEPEVHGLVALMELQSSRSRGGPDGEPVSLLDQDRSRWDRLLIRRGLTALQSAEELGGASGPYALQAALAAGHARANTEGGGGLGARHSARSTISTARAWSELATASSRYVVQDVGAQSCFGRM